MKRYVAILLFLAVILAAPAMLLAEEKVTATAGKTTLNGILTDVFGYYPSIGLSERPTAPEAKTTLNQPKNWTFDIGMQRFLMSHTSYEIGTPDYSPLSRLQFPVDTWWLDFRLRRTCPRWSVGFRSGFSVDRTVNERFKDSDWERDATPQMLTTYSKSAMREEQGYLFRGDVDVNVSDWLKLPKGAEIRPLFAFQFQRFVMMAHDGTQWSNGDYGDPDAMGLDGQLNASVMNGNSIHFRQDYWLYMIGLRGSYEIPQVFKNIALKLSGEAEWGPALGYNEDHHLQRTGALYGFIKSSGNALYFSTGVDMVISKSFSVGVLIDYLWIRTDGVLHHSNVPLKQDSTSSDGMRSWSDQTSLIARASYAF